MILNFSLAEDVSPHGFNLASQKLSTKKSICRGGEYSPVVKEESDGLLARFYKYVYPIDT